MKISEKKNEIIITLIVLIIILVSIIITPKIWNPIKLKYVNQGCQECVTQMVTVMLNDIKNDGFTLLKLNENMSIKLAPIQ